MPIIIGQNPADVYEKAYRFDVGNRANLNEIAGREAQYAFQTNQLLNERARQMANEQQQAQRYANELGRENESIGENRFRFGQDIARTKRLDDFAKLQFDAGQKDVDRRFKMQEQEIAGKRQEQNDEIENAGASLAGAIAQLSPMAQAASARLKLAEADYEDVLKLAAERGLRFDDRKKLFFGDSPSTGTVNQRFGRNQVEMDAAVNALESINEKLQPLEKQARAFRFVIEPEGIRHTSTGRFFPTAAPVQRPAQTPMSAPVQAGPPPQTAAYQVGRVYGGMLYKGGNPNDPANWQRLR